MMPVRLNILGKISLLLIGVMVITILVSTDFTLRSLTAFVDQEVQYELENGNRSTQLILKLRQEHAEVDAEAMAFREDVRQAVAAADRQALLEIIQPLMLEHTLDFLVVTDDSGTVLARGHRSDSFGDNVGAHTVFDWPLRGLKIATIGRMPIVPLVALGGAPIYEHEPPYSLQGTIVAGFALDEAFVAELKNTVGKDISIIVDGKRLYTTLPATDLPAPALDQGAVQSIEIAGQSYRAAYSPLSGLTDGEIIGVLETAHSEASIQAAHSQALTWVGLATMLVGMVVIGMGLWLASRLVKPLSSLTQAVQAFGTGQFGQRVKVETGDEVEDLANAFNQMAAGIERAQAAQTDSEQHFRSLMDSARDFVLYRIAIDPDNELGGSVQFVSPSIREIMGVSDPNDLATWFEHIHEDDARRVLRAHLHSSNTGLPFEQSMRIYHPEKKEWRWVNAISAAVLDGDGKPTHYNGLIFDITERKQAEDALRESEERFRQIAENIKEVFYSSNLDQPDMYYISPAYEEIWGRSRESLYENPYSFLDAIHPDDRQSVREALEEQLQGEETEREYRILRPDGAVRRIRDRAFPLRDESGKVHRVTGVAEDITERKEAEYRLELAVTEMEAIFDVLPDLLFRVDADGTILDYRAADKSALYLPPEQFLDKRLAELFPPSMAQKLGGAIAQTLQQGSLVTIEYDLPMPSGDQYFEARMVPLTEDQVITITRNVTERKQAEEALRDSETRYRAIVEGNTDLICRFLPDTTLTFVNETYCRYFNKTREELLGQSFLTLIPPEAHHAIREKMRNLMKNKQDYSYEHEVNAPNGEIRWQHWTDRPLLNEAGEVVELQSVGRDITEKKRAEEALKAYSERLAEMVEARTRELQFTQERLVRQEKLAVIGQMSGSIAHELRNPLGAIKQSSFYLQRLHDRGELNHANPRVNEHFELIKSEINTVDRVINGMLEITRLKPPRQEAVDLNQVILEAAERSRLQDHIQLRLELECNLFMIWADPLQLRHVFINVLTNASQACTENGQVTISVRSLSDLNQVQIQIQDNGRGVEPESVTKVFEPLFTTKAKGTGLGLSICKQIIEAHGGSITLSSRVNQGTIVQILLPHPKKKLVCSNTP